MPDYDVVTNEAALQVADLIGNNIANSTAVPAVVGKLRLFDETLVPTVDTTQAQLLAKETTLTGYPVGGYSITDMDAPLFVPGGGAVTLSNKIDVVYASGPAVQIGGYWIENAAGDVIAPIRVFDPPRALAVVGDGFPIIVQVGYGRSA